LIVETQNINMFDVVKVKFTLFFAVPIRMDKVSPWGKKNVILWFHHGCKIQLNNHEIIKKPNVGCSDLTLDDHIIEKINKLLKSII